MGNVSRFCAERIVDYGELLSIELAQMKARLVREVIALVGAGGSRGFLRCRSSVSRSSRVSGRHRTSYPPFGAVAGGWLALSVAALLVFKTQRPVWSLDALQEEIRSDLSTVKAGTQMTSPIALERCFAGGRCLHEWPPRVLN